ncbi:hypothetical protein [Glutamicibacter sp. PS]|uniref:hypothetical protein n=1 Tax=Glutamicibacter sp. PS TaxID=3075634 RepID=UPI0028441EC9|nr:hypothetical protein [Glutamicibacter sp. PS]MDR4533233.1 hypothetical protein [Glutamicibacter sp. PS]
MTAAVREVSAAEIRRQICVAKHPASAAPAPRIIDRDRGKTPFTHQESAAVTWPRAGIRCIPGLAAGERVWMVTVWDAKQDPIWRKSFSDEAEALREAEKQVLQAREFCRSVEWFFVNFVDGLPYLSKGSNRPETEPPC